MCMEFEQERAVTKLLDKIMMDRRHKAIIMEHMVPISHRKFDDWGGMKLNNAPLLNKAPKKNAVGTPLPLLFFCCSQVFFFILIRMHGH